MNRKLIKNRRNGFVIVAVLCVVILLTAMLIVFCRRAQMTLRAADSFAKSRQARACSLAGLNLALAALKNNPDIYADTNSGRPLFRPFDFELDGITCTVSITEETGKININALKTPEGTENRVAIEQMLRLIDLLNRSRPDHPISYDLVPIIIDWTDADEHVTCLTFVKNNNLGAESDYYLNLSPPCKSANAPLTSIDQLMLLKGVTPEIFQLLKPFLTVYGDGQININTASAPVIESLSEKMDPALAQLIVERRKIKPFESIEELRALPAMTDEIYLAIKRTATARPQDPCYQVVSRAAAGQSVAAVEVVLKTDSEAGTIETLSYKEL
jgi:general secretion pathway protein K